MKAWCLTEESILSNNSYGTNRWFVARMAYPYNLQIYKGKGTGPKLEALGPRVIEDMASIIRHEDADKHILYFDNFFTSHQLLDNLAIKNLRAIGTVRTNRMMKCPLNILKKDERASLDYRGDGNVLIVQWKDNSVVSIGTNFSSMTSLKKVNRWVKGAGKVAVDQPDLIADDNTGMGEVDLLDMQLASYRPELPSKKCWWPLFNNALNIAMFAAFRIYKRTSHLAPERQLSHLEFRVFSQIRS